MSLSASAPGMARRRGWPRVLWCHGLTALALALGGQIVAVGAPAPAAMGLAEQRVRANRFAPEITLEDAIGLTLANNPRRREQQAVVKGALAAITIAGSTGKPQVNLSGSTTYARNASTEITSGASGASGAGGGASGGASGPTGFQRADLLSVNGTVPITSGGRVRASTRAARFNALAQIYQLAQVEQDLVLAATLGYLNVLRAEQLLRVADSNLVVSNERVRVASLRYSVGASAKLDVLQAQTDLADARTRRTEAITAVGAADAALNVLLDRAPETPLRLADVQRLRLPNLSSLSPTALLTAKGSSGTAGNIAGSAGQSAANPTGAASAGGASALSSSSLQASSVSTRQSLAVARAQIGQADALVQAAKAGRRPQLGLNLTALLRNPATFLGHFGASIGLGLAQDLFDSHRTSSQVAEAEAALDQLKAHYEGQRMEVAAAIETSLLNLDSARLRLDDTAAGVVSAREALRVAQLGFRSGVRTTLDLANAQAALLAAETNAVEARFDVADAQATLAAAIGIYTDEAQNARAKVRLVGKEAAEPAEAGKQKQLIAGKKKRKFLGLF